MPNIDKSARHYNHLLSNIENENLTKFTDKLGKNERGFLKLQLQNGEFSVHNEKHSLGSHSKNRNEQRQNARNQYLDSLKTEYGETFANAVEADMQKDGATEYAALTKREVRLYATVGELLKNFDVEIIEADKSELKDLAPFGLTGDLAKTVKRLAGSLNAIFKQITSNCALTLLDNETKQEDFTGALKDYIEDNTGLAQKYTPEQKGAALAKAMLSEAGNKYPNPADQINMVDNLEQTLNKLKNIENENDEQLQEAVKPIAEKIESYLEFITTNLGDPVDLNEFTDRTNGLIYNAPKDHFQIFLQDPQNKVRELLDETIVSTFPIASFDPDTKDKIIESINDTYGNYANRAEEVGIEYSDYLNIKRLNLLGSPAFINQKCFNDISNISMLIEKGEELSHAIRPGEFKEERIEQLQEEVKLYSEGSIFDLEIMGEFLEFMENFWTDYNDNHMPEGLDEQAKQVMQKCAKHQIDLNEQFGTDSPEFEGLMQMAQLAKEDPIGFAASLNARREYESAEDLI